MTSAKKIDEQRAADRAVPEVPPGELAGVPRPSGPVARMLARVIIAYRRWISPVMPARCRFYPSCSAYGLEAVSRHGAVRGTGLAVWRVLRCQPFHPGGYDPVPEPRRHRRDVEVSGAVK